MADTLQRALLPEWIALIMLNAVAVAVNLYACRVMAHHRMNMLLVLLNSLCSLWLLYRASRRKRSGRVY